MENKKDSIQTESHSNRKKLEIEEINGEITQCPLFCNTELNMDTYTDHIIQCEESIETCENCGIEFKENKIHWGIEIHSKVTQRFSCTECMQTRKIKLKLVEQHRNRCLRKKINCFEEEFTTNLLDQADSSPKEMGENLKAEYGSNKTFKKGMKKDFKRRSNDYAKERKRYKLDPITKVYSIMGIIAIIYMSTYIVVRATQEEETKNTSAQNQNESRQHAQISLQPSKPQATARIKIRKKSNIPADPGPKTAEIISDSNPKKIKDEDITVTKPPEISINQTAASSYKLNKEVDPKEEKTNLTLMNIPEIKGTVSTYEKNNSEQNQSPEQNKNSEEDENETELSKTKLYTNPSSSPSSSYRDQQAEPSNYLKKEADPKEEEVNLIVLNTSEIEGTLSSSTPDTYKGTSNIEQNQSHKINEKSEDDGNDTELSNMKLHTNPSSSPSSPSRDQRVKLQNINRKPPALDLFPFDFNDLGRNDVESNHASCSPFKKRTNQIDCETILSITPRNDLESNHASYSPFKTRTKQIETDNIEQNQSHRKNENDKEDGNDTELSNMNLYTTPSSSPSPRDRLLNLIGDLLIISHVSPQYLLLRQTSLHLKQRQKLTEYYSQPVNSIVLSQQKNPLGHLALVHMKARH